MTNFFRLWRAVRPVRLAAFLLLLPLLWPRFGSAQPTAAGSLLTPGQFLGYPLGSRFTPHAQLLRYVEHVAQNAGGRMRVQPYGSTYEGRPLEVVQIGTPENLTRLDDIRRNNLRLAGLESGAVQGQQPAVVWLSYNIHGNEAVSSEAVMEVLYDLANPQNEPARQWLQNVVLLIDPCVNPDGHERYVQWYGRVRNQQPNASPYAWEHYEPWPGGRFNHYFFDLNRDWAWQTQQESKARLALYNQWLPQVHADFHEMSLDDPYYFSPAAKPFHEDITPWQRNFQNIIGDYNRRVFDKNNWLYFTRETYDLFYPSYGDTYPSFNGAIGMTYEQGGSGRAGVRVAKADGDTLTLRQRIDHHHAASLATIQAAADRRPELVREFEQYFTTARTKPRGPYKTFVLAGSGDPGQLRAFTQYLDRQQIRYGYAPRRQRTSGFSYASGKNENVQIEAQDLVVSMYQPKSTLVKVLFEPQSRVEDSLTYDITAWALPYAFGLKAYALRDRLEADPKAAAKPAVTGPSAAETPYAYVARWSSLQDLRFLSRLLQQRVKVRVAQREFEAEGQKYQPGTLVITRTGNESLGPRFDQLVRAQADSAGVLVRAVQSGFSTTGADLGSGYVRYVSRPNVAVVAGEGVSPTAFGEVWHFFEQQIGYPVTVLGADYLRNVPLQKFDVLILPDGDYADIYSEKSLENLKAWVRGGGKLIALEGAASFLANKKDFLLRTKPTDTTAAKRASPYRLLRRYADAERAPIDDRVQGSVYRVQLDNSHPLAFGYGSTYFALVRDTLNYRFLSKGGWNVGVLKRDAYAAGFAGRDARRKLTDTFVLGSQEMGRGQVVYLADNPLFRGFWQGGKLLFGNALFFVGQ
ncbi:Zinc carboxypeptidase [Hymenobacter daecheongensis DSM 21074]|uniref:Zinc carboxypeptidase n=1 Tax=Hymenobacter daecheongensis DSM 21074 TaxID=1121955 RepID=A0A1M6C9U8_9BACT|nr:M14 family metallopeptidase [Hymenobacter daecheongensis]SHI57518.1 Zinc carboxypeptidase [Hymenobacter daecheongensis DSM 21074]